MACVIHPFRAAAAAADVLTPIMDQMEALLPKDDPKEAGPPPRKLGARGGADAGTIVPCEELQRLSALLLALLQAAPGALPRGAALEALAFAGNVVKSMNEQRWAGGRARRWRRAARPALFLRAAGARGGRERPAAPAMERRGPVGAPTQRRLRPPCNLHWNTAHPRRPAPVRRALSLPAPRAATCPRPPSTRCRRCCTCCSRSATHCAAPCCGTPRRTRSRTLSARGARRGCRGSRCARRAEGLSPYSRAPRMPAARSAHHATHNVTASGANTTDTHTSTTLHAHTTYTHVNTHTHTQNNNTTRAQETLYAYCRASLRLGTLQAMGAGVAMAEVHELMMDTLTADDFAW